MIAAFLLLLLQVAPTTPQPVPDAIQGNSNPIRVAPVDVRKDVFDYASVLAGLLLTVATFLIAIYAAIQARAAKRSANAYEQTVRLTERADVLLNRAGFDTPSLSGASRVIFTFKNFGRTRANNVRFAMSVTIPELDDYPPHELPEMPIGAGDTQDVVFMKMSEWLTKETFDKIARGETTLRFKGSASYTDVFGRMHTTTCSGALNKRTFTFGVEKNQAD
jgi:hypothetical protein